MSALPLKNDYLENGPLFRALFHLINTNSPALAPFVDQLLAVFTFVLNPDGPEQIGDETRQGLLEVLVLFNRQMPEKVAAAGLTVFLPST